MNQDTLLFRQIHPSWIRNDRVTSQAFTPTPKDERKLSVYDGDQIAAVDACRHFAYALGRPSVGVVAVTVGECQAKGTAPSPEPSAFPEHAIIDFSGLTNTQVRSAGKMLSNLAGERGWQYCPPPAERAP